MKTYDVEITTQVIRVTRHGHDVISWTAAEWEANPDLVPTIAQAIKFVLTATPEEIEERLIAGLVAAHHNHAVPERYGMLTREDVLADGYELRIYPASRFYSKPTKGFLLYRVKINGTSEALVDQKPRPLKELREWCIATFGKEPRR